MRCPPAVVWTLSLALSTAPAAAVDNQPSNPTELAKQRFQEAREAYKDGRYAAAASLFEAADRLAPHPSTRYNSATAWEQAGENARAATGYEAALATPTLDAGRRKVAEERLSSLEQGLGKILVLRPLGAFVTVDHMQRAPVPATFYLLPGSYEIVVEYEGKTSTTPLEVLAGRQHDVKLDLGEPAPAVPSAPAAATKPLPPPPPADAGVTQETWGWVSVGAGVALGGAAIVLGLRALDARDRFVESQNTDADAHGDAAGLRLATNVLWGGATAAGITGLVLVLTAPTVEF
jgi:tetratricopeptide (TPR) repeat protein